MPQLATKVKVERAIAKYGDSSITTKKNGKNIFCTVCKFDIRFKNNNAGFCIKSHINSRSHRMKTRGQGLDEAADVQVNVENVQPEVCPPSSQCCSCCHDPCPSSDHSLDSSGCSTCGQMSNMSDFTPSQDLTPTQAILPEEVKPLSEHDRETKELQMEKLKLEVKERKLNLMIQEREGEERIKLFQKLNSCDFGQLITALVGRGSVVGPVVEPVIESAVESVVGSVVESAVESAAGDGDAIDQGLQAEDQGGEEESVQY